MADMMLSEDEKTVAEFDLNAVYSGRALSAKKKDVTEEEYALQETERVARRFFNLAVTKQLVYYPLPYNHTTKSIDVVTYRVVDSKTYSADISKKATQVTWYTLEVTLANEKKVRIHCDFLSEMQKPNFIDSVNQEEIDS